MKRYGIERQTLWVTLAPVLVMAFLLDSYFITTRFADMDRTLIERSRLLARQLASSCEYPVFSGNAILLKQNVDTVLSFQDVASIRIFDDKPSLILEAGIKNTQPVNYSKTTFVPLFQNEDILRLYEPIVATQINLDSLTTSLKPENQLGSVVVEISKASLNKKKEKIFILSFLTTLLIFGITILVAVRAAKGISNPILQMYRSICKIGRGELEEVTYPASGVYELHELSEGINEMRKQLLRDREMLESRITEATVVLREKKDEVAQVNLEKKKLNDDLAIALTELQAIMEANPDILYVFNTKSELIQWNSNFEKFFGLPAIKLLHRHLSDFVYKDDRAAAENCIQEIFANGSATVELQFARYDGALVPFLCNGVVLKNAQGEVTGYTGTGRDISERKAAAQRIQHMAHFDMLTDLPNRSLLSDRLQQAISTCKRERSRLAVMFLDLDMFKFINDKHGHEIGDFLLREVAIRIRSCLRETDTAARIGGDEFIVLLPSIDTEQTALMIAEKIRNAIDLPFLISGKNLTISTSIGIAIYPDHGSEERVLLKNADTAMYQAKQKGRNAITFFSS